MVNEKAIDKISIRILRDFADFIFTLSQDNLTSMGIDDRGFLRGSGNVIENPDSVDVEYTAEYAAAVNDGSKPHPVSDEGVNSIRAWVERKLSVPAKDVNKVANAIVWKIRKLGQQPKPFLTAAIETAKIKYKGKLDVR